MNVLLTPHITEKSYRMISENAKEASTYTFKINQDLDKEIVKRIVERDYKVHVVSVQIINLPAKKRRFRGRLGKTSAVKKALVRLKAGERIAAFEQQPEKATDKE